MVTVITRLHNYATRLGSVGAIVAVITFIPVFWPTQEGDPAAAYAAVEGDDTGQVTSPDIKNTTVVQREPDVDQRDPADVTLIKTQQAIVDKLVDQLSADDQLNNEQVREAIADAVSGLAETDGEPSDIERAEQALADGKTELAMDLYRADALSKLEQGEAQLQAAAASYRRLGALAYLDDSDTVLEAYQIAVSLWPDDTDAWNQLGNLYGLDGELDDETFDFRETMIAKGYANLGLIYQSSGELDRAIELLEKALVIDKELGYKDVIASDYANLASVIIAKVIWIEPSSFTKNPWQLKKNWATRKAWPATTPTWGAFIKPRANGIVPSNCTKKHWRLIRSSATRKAWPSTTATWESFIKPRANGIVLSSCTKNHWRLKRSLATRKAWPTTTPAWGWSIMPKANLTGLENIGRNRSSFTMP